MSIPYTDHRNRYPIITGIVIGKAYFETLIKYLFFRNIFLGLYIFHYFIDMNINNFKYILKIIRAIIIKT